MKEIIDLSFWQLLAAYVFVLILILIVKIKRIPREKEILLGTVRMTIQLILAGYILVYLFENTHPLLTPILHLHYASICYLQCL
jgi:putative ABC transport system permease protein